MTHHVSHGVLQHQALKQRLLQDVHVDPGLVVDAYDVGQAGQEYEVRRSATDHTKILFFNEKWKSK